MLVPLANSFELYFNTNKLSEAKKVDLVTDTGTLLVGRIPFLVCAPFFHQSLSGLPGVTFREGTPRVLNALLAEGLLDCAPSSSFEYALHSERYLLLPNLCTSGRGEVKSVLFLSQVPWEKLAGKRIVLSPDSDTSNALFQVLSRYHFVVEPTIVNGDANLGNDFVGQIFIGDAALRESQTGRWSYRYDLAACWENWQHHPLPLGLWMIQAETWKRYRQEVTQYWNHLQDSIASFFHNPSQALSVWDKKYPLPFSMEEALAFYGTTDYHLSESHLKGLLAFYHLCFRAGLLPNIPKIQFASLSLD